MSSFLFRLRGLTLVWLLLVGVNAELRAQTPAGSAAQEPPRYEIGGVSVSGIRYLDPNTLVSLTGLKVGDPISIPGEELGRAIRRLWDQGILGDINVVVERIEGNRVFLDFQLKERPRLSKIYFTSISKTQADELRNKVKIVRGKVVTDALLSNTKQAVRKFYTDKGFMNVKVNITQEPDSSLPNSVELVIDVKKGDKVRISDIAFIGNEAIKDGKLKGQMKKTKEKKGYKFLNSGKYQKSDFEDDKQKVIDYYNSQGYRDAIITGDSLVTIQDTYTYRWLGTDESGKFGIHKATVREADKLALRIYVDEGPKYYFRNIAWSGNYLYDDKTLGSVLGIKRGDTYSKESLDKRLNYNPTGQDVTSLYMNDGYLFFSIDPVETLVEGDSIDIEMRLSEGVQARIKDINIAGNTKTSDHVIRRELRTLPGDKFNRELLIRSQREISSLGYFDPEKVGLNPVPNPADGTVDINYTVSEKPSDQITLSGGWGGYAGFIGTVGLVFNNFSLRKAGNFSNWRPVPGGDGQRLALNIQANGLQYQSYSFSFTEPWLGGRKPNSLSVSLNKSIQRYSTGGSFDIESGSFIKVNSASVSLGRRLRWPDDYFTLSNSFSVSQYKLKDYPYFSGFNTGIANNITFNTTLARNSTDNPTFTRRGSALSLSLSLTPPYSTFKGAHPDVNEWIEFHKWMFDASWFTPLVGKLVLNTRAHFGFIGNYNNNREIGPFERFKLGGAGLGFGGAANFLVGTEFVGLRGYDDPNEQFAIQDPNSGGGVAYNKYVMELRYPVSLNPAATVFVLGFAEAGNSFNKYRDYNPYKLYRSAGIGARIFMSAFGLLGFDYGIGFDNVTPYSPTAAKQDKGKFHFIIGQQIR